MFDDFLMQKGRFEIVKQNLNLDTAWVGVLNCTQRTNFQQTVRLPETE